MDLVKSKPVQSVKPTEAPKQSAPKAKPEADAAAAKMTSQQTQRPTTNMRGETLGQLLNVSA